ncbi:MAG: FecR domain-containing protein, partial [Sulfuricaulis sp.]|nr:FecR domain-containing protein [Sulfuricaulis sp.]
MRKFVPTPTALFLVFIIALSPVAQAADPVGKVTHLSGLLTAKRADGSRKVISVKSDIQEGDTLSTEQDTYARVKFADGGEILLRPGSQLEVKAYSFNQGKPESDNVVLNIFKGGLRAVTGLIGKRNRDSVQFATATATIGIRGTHFGALICQNDCGGVPTASGKPPPNGLHLDVADGAVVVRNSAGQQQVSSGQFGYVRDAVTAPAVVPPQQGIVVSMPIAISQNKSDGRGLGKAKEG